MTEEITLFIKDFFNAADVAIRDVQIKPDPASNILAVGIFMDDAGPYIGDNGVNLKDFEFVLRLLVKKKWPDAPHVVIDINGYRKEKEELIRNKARQAAKEAALKKEAVALEAMNAYERRLIHLELAGRPDVITESVGEGPHRRVIVKPYP